ncbi:hypothetical protein Tco_1449105 [Tanacetum coccineum]
MSFIRRSYAAPVCHRKPLDSVKNLNDHFFWVDSTAFPLSVSLKSKILSKDPSPKLSQYDTEACDFLRTHTAPFQKFPKPFLCWVGISRYYTQDENCYLTFWDEMDVFAFIRHFDPTKVRIKERDLAEREFKLPKMTEGHTILLDPPVTAASGDSGDGIDRLFDEGNDAGKEHSVERDDDVLEETIAKDALEVVAEKTKKKQKRKVTGNASGSTHPPKKLRDNFHSLPPNTSGKSLAALRGMISEGSGIPSGATEPPVAASMAPMPDVGPVDSVSGLNLSLVADAPVVTVVVTTTVVADVATISGSKARDASKDFENIRDSTSAGGDRLALLALFMQLRAMDYDQLYSEFNVGVARQVCLGAKVRMRAEHTLEKKGELEDKCVEQIVLLSERDVSIAHLKSLLSLKETEAAEAIRLRGQLTAMEAVDDAKDSELKDLKEKKFVLEGERDIMSEKIATLESANIAKEAELASLSSQVAKLTSDLSDLQLARAELNSQVASLESERDGLISQRSLLDFAFELISARMEATQDEQAKVLGTRVAELDAQLLEMVAHLDEDFYPRFLTVISRQRWILTHELKLVILKCLQSLEYCHALGTTISCAVNKGIQDSLRAGVDHGKAGRDLSIVEAYDPSAEAKYVEGVNALGAVDFSFLSELKSKKDASIVDLMDSLRLEGPLAEIPGAEDLQPSPD